MKTMGQKIRERREYLGMTQKELAKKVGYSSDTTIAKIEAGINDLNQTKIALFADALEVSPVDLLSDAEKPVNSDELPAIKNKCVEMLNQLERENPALYRVALAQLEAMLNIASSDKKK